MHVVITSQVYPPELHPTAVMMEQLARHLTKKGHSVTVAVGLPHHPNGRLPDGYDARPFAFEILDGVHVHRCWHVTSRNMKISARAAVMGSQTMAMVIAGAVARKADVVLSVGPPLVGPLLSGLLSRLHGAALVSVIYDLYPDIIIESGKLKNRSAIAAARVAEAKVYEMSDALVVLSEGFRSTLIARGVSDEKIRVVAVWLDQEEVRPMSRDNAWRREHDIPLDRFVVLYAGTIGLVSGASVVIDAADQLRNDQQIEFLVVGEGRLVGDLVTLARNRDLQNIRFLPFQPRRRLAELQATADVSLVTLLPGRGRTSVPSKVLGYMAAARPVIASVDADCDTAQLVRGSRAGVVVSPGNATQLADAIRKLSRDDETCSELGVAGRRAFEQLFTGERALGLFEQALLDACRRHSESI